MKRSDLVAFMMSQMRADLHRLTPPANERMSPEKGPFQKEFSVSNHQVLGDMFVFGGGSMNEMMSSPTF